MIPLPSNPKIIEKKDNKVTFEIEGLYPGYGMTIGNSIRRVLYSSLEGAAVTRVKIKGAQHEFSTIPGVLEDIISIILNVKKLRFKVFSDGPEKATLKAKGEKTVKGSDLKLPTQLELINQDAHIATLTDKKSNFEMEIQVEKGLGYVPAEQEKDEKLDAGQISVDAIFTPIKNINFKIENMRVGKRTDFDRLFIEIETDGTINSEDALVRAGEILVSHFSQIVRSGIGGGTEREVEEKVGDPGKTKIEDLEIGVKITKILIENNIKTAAGLLKKSRDSLSQIQGMGDKGIEKIEKALKKAGLGNLKS